jgi:DNA-binding transcriptional ArsR family regulator
MRVDPDVPAVAALLAEPSRVAILLALQDGSARPAGELARLAGVSPATASAHLARLVEAGLLVPVRQGRHRFYRSQREELGQVFELLAGLARPVRARTSAHDAEARRLRFARTCYGHLAGWLGVAIADALCERGLLSRRDLALELTDAGRRWFTELGVPCAGAAGAGRACVDWSERRPHLAGPLGTALARRLVDAGHLVRARDGRAVRVSDRGRAWLRRELGVDPDAFGARAARDGTR